MTNTTNTPSGPSTNELIGAELKQARLRVGYGLREFCRLTDQDVGNYSQIEKGRRPVSLKKVIELATMLKHKVEIRVVPIK